MTATPIRESGEVPPRIPSLDGLRALVLLIVAFHFSLEAARATPGWLSAPVWLAGALGSMALDVFFVLSGFLITGILLDTKGAPRYFSNFYVRRAARILPLYYGFLAFYLLLLPDVVSWDPVSVSLTWREQLPYWLYYVNVAFAMGERLAAFAGHYWSLSIEEQFYIAWPLVVFLCSRERLRVVALACLVVVPIARTVASYAFPEHILLANMVTPLRIDGLALGALLSIAWRTPGRMPELGRRLRSWGVAGLLGIVLLVAWMLPELRRGEFDWRLSLFLTLSVWCAGAVVSAMLLGRAGVFQRVAETGVARRIGTYSYGIYLIHDPLAHIFDQAGWLTRPGAGTTVSSLLGYLVVMGGISVGVAALSWHAIEQPILRLRPRQTRSAPVPTIDPPAQQRGVDGAQPGGKAVRHREDH